MPHNPDMPRDRRRRPPSALFLALTIGLSVIACSPSAAKPADTSTPIATATQEPTPRPTPRSTPKPTPTAEPTPEITPEPSLIAADLDGMLVAPELAHRQPIAISIDDAKAARPQSGFNGTSIVWHAPADGYEARYLLVFQELDSKDVGPVRSARLYLAHWAAEVRASFGHYGGDRITRTWLRWHPQYISNVDGIGSGNPAYHRISSRRAPHNAYTSTADMRRQATKMGAPTEFGADLHTRPFRDDSPESARGTKQSIIVPFRTVTVGYAYDAAANGYRRGLNGTAQVDPADGKVVTARTVVVMFAKFRIDTKIEPGHARPNLTDIGSGTAWVFSEGKLVEATWRKKDAAGPTRFLDKDGHEISFVRGRIFIEVVPPGTKVTH